MPLWRTTASRRMGIPLAVATANYPTRVSAFNPLGYDDTFHLGEPVKLLGGSFSCTDEAKWELKAGLSISRKSVGKMELSYKNLVNLDKSLDETKPENKINNYTFIYNV